VNEREKGSVVGDEKITSLTFVNNKNQFSNSFTDSWHSKKAAFPEVYFDWIE
jgi:hypothetical protein